MARMSIDDKFLRDGRVKLLGQRLGWSRRETMGALLDVFAVAYDQENDIIPLAEIDAAADKQGFALMMSEVNLGEIDGDDMRIKGAGERIEYLAKKREAGAKGGRKSGESRRKLHEAKRSIASEARQASWNPPDPVPDLPPDPVPEDQKLSLPRDPAVQIPRQALPQPAVPPDDHRAPTVQDRRMVRDQIREEINAARARVGAKLGTALHPCLPFDRGLDADLTGQLALATTREQLEAIAVQARHAVAMAELEAAAEPDRVQFLSGAIFSGGNFARLTSQTPEGVAAAARKRAGPKSSALRATGNQAVKSLIADIAAREASGET